MVTQIKHLVVLVDNSELSFSDLQGKKMFGKLKQL